MGNFFNSMEDAVAWLYVNGWRQDRDGIWFRYGVTWGERDRKEFAKINRSPANDGVVCVSFAAH